MPAPTSASLQTMLCATRTMHAEATTLLSPSFWLEACSMSLVCLQAPYNAVAMWSVPPQLRSLALSTQVGLRLSP